MTQTNNEREALLIRLYKQIDILNAHKDFNETVTIIDLIDSIKFIEQSPISQNEQQEAVAYAWEYESPDKTWKSITSNKTELQDHLDIGCTLVRKLFTSPPKQVIPEGWKLVPIEPTPEMIVALKSALENWKSDEDCYKAMINAAPTNTEVGE